MKTRKPSPKEAKPRRGEAGRRRSGRPEAERKDHVLQTRVPPSLHNQLVDQARRLRVPVSNLVRNILEDSTRLVENIVDGGIEIAEALGKGLDDRDLSSVLGWQPMIANRRLACSRCGGSIQKGEEAFISLGAPGGRTFVICEGCRCKI